MLRVWGGQKPPGPDSGGFVALTPRCQTARNPRNPGVPGRLAPGCERPETSGIRVLGVSGHLTPGLSGPGPSAVKVNHGNQINSEQSCLMICP